MNSKKIKPSTVLLYLALSLGAVIMVLPFLWTALSSVKSMGQIFTVPPTIIPRPFVWKNYPESLAALPFGRAYFNSFYIAAIVVVVQLLTASMAGYAFAKLKFKGHNVIFVLFLATMMIPSQVTMIPLFIIHEKPETSRNPLVSDPSGKPVQCIWCFPDAPVYCFPAG